MDHDLLAYKILIVPLRLGFYRLLRHLTPMKFWRNGKNLLWNGQKTKLDTLSVGGCLGWNP